MTKKRKAQIEKWKDRPFSWSQISSWQYDKSQWAFKYILGNVDEANNAMRFGSLVGESFTTDDPMVPHIIRYPEMEYELTPKMNDIKLIGYLDSWHPDEKKLREYKTSQNSSRWNQKSVDEHGQLTMYALLLLLQDKIMPEDIEMHLDYIPVKENGAFELELVDPNKIFSFETRRTTEQALTFGSDIVQIRKAMEDYAINML